MTPISSCLDRTRLIDKRIYFIFGKPNSQTNSACVTWIYQKERTETCIAEFYQTFQTVGKQF